LTVCPAALGMKEAGATIPVKAYASFMLLARSATKPPLLPNVCTVMLCPFGGESLNLPFSLYHATRPLNGNATVNEYVWLDIPPRESVAVAVMVKVPCAVYVWLTSTAPNPELTVVSAVPSPQPRTSVDTSSSESVTVPVSCTVGSEPLTLSVATKPTRAGPRSQPTATATSS